MDIVTITKRLLQEKHSGGAKFLELLPDIIEEYRKELENDTKSDTENFFKNIAGNQILNKIQESKELGVLEYYWEIADILRNKYFIYLIY